MQTVKVLGSWYGVKSESSASENQVMEVCVRGKDGKLYAAGQQILAFWEKLADAVTLHLRHICAG